MGLLSFLFPKRDAKPQASSIISSGESRWWPAFYRGETAAKVEVTYENALCSSAVYACTRAIAENIGSLPGMVYKVRGQVREPDLDSDPGQLLYCDPNPEMDAMTFIELGISRLVNRGNFFAEIERDEFDRPVALWPIHNSRVEPMRDSRSGDLYWRIHVDDTVYTDDPKTKFHDIPARNMLNVCGFGGNGIVAPGVIAVAREEIAVDFAAQQFGASFFGQGAKMAGIVEHPGFIDDEATMRNFREDINRIHSGRENWHQIGVLWEGARYKEIQVSPSDAQFIETRKFSGKQICQFYNVPPAIVQIFDDYKFSTVDAMLRQFVQLCLRPYAVRLEMAVNRQVLKVRNAKGRLESIFRGEHIYELLLESLIRGDAKTQAETLEIERRNGIISADDWRRHKREAPVGEDKGGDTLIVPGGFQRLDQVGAMESKTPAPKQQQDPEDDTTAKYSRDTLIKALEQVVKPKASSPGFDPRAMIRESACEIARDAVSRINDITASQIQRWSGKEEVDTAAFVEKQRARLAEALLPACRLMSKFTNDNPQEIATEMAKELVVVGEITEDKLQECLNAAFS